LKNCDDMLIPQVLILDKDPAATRVLLEVFARRAIRGVVADPDSCSQRFAGAAFDMVFCALDEHKTQARPADTIRHLKASRPEQVVIAMLNSDSSKLAVAAIRAGYAEAIAKPLQPEVIGRILDSFLPNEKVPVAAAGGTEAHSFKIVGNSPQMQAAIEMAGRAGRTSIPVMITGESGTGKELFASLVHSVSLRCSGPYIRLNCAAISDSLLESELFGHEKGAFTGAYARRKGRFERAHGGTLLLDEITETPMKFQAELLRVIEQQDFERVGGDESVSVNVRIISTTNKDMLREVEKGNFREDLYYRLGGAKLRIPPLRDRKEDLPALIGHFINLYARESGRHITGIDPLAMEIFESYNWPGNVRQLRNVIRTALVLGSGEVLSPGDIGHVIEELTNSPLLQGGESGSLAGRPLHQIEQQAIIATLTQMRGNQTRAAKTLGISDRTLREKIKKYRRQGDLQLTA
jgi:DNA-binding NtrC family response regulator